VSIKDKIWYPVVYIFVITLFFTAILILFGNFTRERIKNNTQIAFERAVLEALPINLPQGMSLVKIHRFYVENIQAPDTSSGRAYKYSIGDSLIAYALPIAGPGFWARVAGVIGIAADKKTITGIAFYEQEETPGLGGEIANPLFRNQFIGKHLSFTGTPIEIRMPTQEIDDNSVHAITGATQTSQRVGKFLNEQIAAWQQELGSRE
jgi:Na+-transporting NADH:ubiquinone oxidoreductase subunit C